MISVFRGDFHYRYDGKKGVLTNMLNDVAVVLSENDMIACNKSNNELDKVIEKFKNIEKSLDY